TAQILASGPTIHDVAVVDTSAMSATIAWATNEPATTEVRYGTTAASLTRDANTSDLVTSHAITLTNLAPDTAYVFEVTSRGRLANATTDTNGGGLYHLQTTPLGDVLLVIGGNSFTPERETSYLSALRSNGWTASVWHVADLGPPDLTILQGRRAVIWQVSLEQYPPFNATERDLVKRYLDGGGRLIVSSHDAAWALSDPNSTFRTPASAAWVHGVLKATFVCDPGSIARVAAILDAALRWLVSAASSGLDRDHPDVNITSPNGGVFAGPMLAVDWTAAAYGPGVGIADFTLDASSDGGQTWTSVATLPGSVRSYTWNLGATTNGDRYRLRITARDDGTPALSATDVTQRTFTIERPNGDAEGPVLWAGSVRIAPLPPGAALSVTFVATADDRTHGGSAIAAAELFLQIARPPAGATGQGISMSASDGGFDGAVENVTWQEGLTSAPGMTCVWIHARDAAGNWGPYDSRCFVVINAGPD